MSKTHKIKHKKRRGIEGKATEIDIDDVEDLKVFDGEETAEETVPDQAQSTESDIQNIFFGLLDRQELEYFKQAESTLNANSFGSDEEKTSFVDSVIEEMAGKELKLVTSQICSKLVERILFIGSDEQVKKIFKSFDGHFVQLSLHKYASHCLETLIVRSASMTEKEILHGIDTVETEESFITAESMVMHISEELKEHVLKLLCKHKYGSHVLRMMIIVLAGFEIPSNRSRSALRSKKSKIARKLTEIVTENSSSEEFYGKAHQVPARFKQALGDLIGNMASELDTGTARELAIDKVSSPVIQLAMKSEAESKKKKGKETRIAHIIFNQNEGEENFVEYLLSDAVGCHFFEATINSGLSSDQIKRLYSSYIETRLLKVARRDYGSYVIAAIIRRVKPNEARKIIQELVDDAVNGYPDIIIQSLIETSKKLKFDDEKITEKIIKTHFQNDILHFLDIDKILQDQERKRTDNDAEVAAKANLCIALADTSDKTKKLLAESLINMGSERIIAFGCNPILSRIFEKCLVPSLDVITRRKLMNLLTSENTIISLVCNAYGSHIVDKLWSFAYKLKFQREKIAEELAANETKVKDSLYGKKVWKNWNMEKYVRKRFEWWNIVKDEEDRIGEQLGLSRPDSQKENGSKSNQTIKTISGMKRNQSFDSTKQVKKIKG